MTVRRAFAPAILFGVFLSFPATSQVKPTPPAVFHRSDYERPLSDLQLLGKRIFEDLNLSEPKGVACESCHDRKRAFQGDNRSPIPGVAVGSRPGQFGNRKPPTIMYMAYSPAFGFDKVVDGGEEKLEARGGQFWDGRAADLVEQPSGPLMNPIEMNNPSPDAVVEKVKTASLRADDDMRFSGRTRSPTRRRRSCALRSRCPPTRPPGSSRPSPPSSTTICAARSRSRRSRRAAWRCSSIPSAAIASPATPASRNRRSRATGCSPTSLMTRSASRAMRRSPPTPTR